MATVYIGTSGYVYDHWKGDMYPEDLPRKEWLAHYCRQFRTVEINNSFYQLPKRSNFAAWREVSPTGFVFAVKMNRYLTHMKKLKDPEKPLESFLAAASGLGKKLGPVLFQLPPNYRAHPGRLDELLSYRRKQRWVLEFRNRDWFRDEILDILRSRGAGFCIHDLTPGCPVVVTADFAYVRFHGDRKHDGNYTRRTLRQWASCIEAWLHKDFDVYAYFNNDVGGHAFRNARTLQDLLG